MFTDLKNIYLSAAKKRNSLGFTRVEIITALLILALVTLTVSISFYFVFTKTRLLRQENQTFNNAAFAMQIIAKDIYETVVTPRPGFLPAHLTESGRHDKLRFLGLRNPERDELSGDNSFYRLTFSSLNSLKFENTYKNAPIQIVYYLDHYTDADGGLILRRQTNHLPYPETFIPKASDPILMKDIHSIRFTYYDVNGSAFTEWDSENPYSGFATPAMLEISVTAGVGDKPFSLGTTIKLPCRRMATVFAELP